MLSLVGSYIFNKVGLFSFRHISLVLNSKKDMLCPAHNLKLLLSSHKRCCMLRNAFMNTEWDICASFFLLLYFSHYIEIFQYLEDKC